MQISFNPQDILVRELMLNNLYKVKNLILKNLSATDPRAVCLQRLYIFFLYRVLSITLLSISFILLKPDHDLLLSYLFGSDFLKGR